MKDIDENELTTRYLSWGHQLFISSPSSRTFFISLVIVFISLICFICFSFLFSVELSIVTHGKVKRLSPPVKVYAPVKSEIVLVKVKNGDVVEVGSPLAEISKDGVHSIIRSDVNGIVGQTNGVKGALVNESKPLFQIIKNHEPLIIESYVSSSDIAKVKKGKKVYIAIDAFSKTRYGYFDGSVQDVELVPQFQSREITSSRDQYRIVIVINPESLKKIGEQKLYPEMSAESKIIWKKEKIITIISDFLL